MAEIRGGKSNENKQDIKWKEGSPMRVANEMSLVNFANINENEIEDTNKKEDIFVESDEKIRKEEENQPRGKDQIKLPPIVTKKG